MGPGEKPGPMQNWKRGSNRVHTWQFHRHKGGTIVALNADVESDKAHNISSTGWVQN